MLPRKALILATVVVMTGAALPHVDGAGVAAARTVVTITRAAKPSVAQKLFSTRFSVPLGKAPTLGPADAPVTVVVFGGFQCIYTRRTLHALLTVHKGMPKKLRIVFKQFPLRMHSLGWPSATASVAAQNAKKFWTFARAAIIGPRLTQPGLAAAAIAAGMNKTQLAAALTNTAARGRVNQDLTLGRQLGVRGTPTLFINGANHGGGKSVAALKGLIAQHLAFAKKAFKLGAATAKNLYARIVRFGKKRVTATSRYRPLARRHLRRPRIRIPLHLLHGSGYKEIDLAGAPARGPRDAAVTVVLHTNFSCYSAEYVLREYETLRRQYPETVRLMFRHHKISRYATRQQLAAEAAVEAGRQGRFWEYADLLLRNRYRQQRAQLLSYAADLDLDLDAFRKALDLRIHRKKVQAEVALSDRVVRSTDCLVGWINGRFYSGYRVRTEMRRAASRLSTYRLRPLP